MKVKIIEKSDFSENLPEGGFWEAYDMNDKIITCKFYSNKDNKIKALLGCIQKVKDSIEFEIELTLSSDDIEIVENPKK